jgi:hypothetical protein
LDKWDKNDVIFKKRTGEAIENTWKWLKNEAERTGKRSEEVVENTYLWKKRTENGPTNS